jgi:hypothetical protein
MTTMNKEALKEKMEYNKTMMSVGYALAITMGAISFSLTKGLVQIGVGIGSIMMFMSAVLYGLTYTHQHKLLMEKLKVNPRKKQF